MVRFLLSFVFFSHFLFSYQVIEDQSQLQYLNPDLSKRKTAKIVLDNGIKAYLISDANFQKSAAAATIEAGSWNDPNEYPGMAHFLEHMLFQGTAAYPDESEFIKFINDHGGQNNAFTGNAYTTYLFSIENDYFLPALDRFSHFFIDPLLKKSCVDKELHAVNNEYGLYLENDMWRFLHIWQETANPSHPFSRFSIGTADTLSKIPLEELRKWFESHYSSKNMYLIVCSNLPMDKLTAETVKTFQQVPPRPLQTENFSFPCSSSAQKNNYVFIQPFENTKTMYLLWEINDPKIIKDPTHSIELIFHCLSSSHQQSLQENLKNQHLINELSPLIMNLDKEHKICILAINMTEKGVKQYETVIQSVYSYLNLLKNQKIPKSLYEEKRRMDKLNYEYQSQEKLFPFISMHARSIPYETLATYPQNMILPQKYNQKNISYALQALSPSNVQIYILANPELTKVPPTNKEKWLGGEYAFLPVPFKTKQTWEKTISSDFTLPQENIYAPSDKIFQPVSHSHTLPTTLIENEHGCLVYGNDHAFAIPENCLVFHLQSPLFTPTAESLAKRKLLLHLLEKKLMPLIEAGQKAGLIFSYDLSPFAIKFSLNGYCEKTSVFYHDILQTIQTMIISDEDFEDIYQEVMINLENYQKETLYKQALQNFYRFTCSLPSKAKQKSALEKITKKDVSSFFEQIINCSYIDITACGNISQKEAKEIFLTTVQALSQKPFPKKDHYLRKAFNFPQKQGPFHLIENNSLQGNAVLLAIDEGTYSFHNQAAHEVLSDSITDDFHSALRTQQKTAYFATNINYNIYSHLYQAFIVQSFTHDVYDLLYRFEIFLDDFIQNIGEKVSQKRFETIKSNRITALKNPPKNLLEYTRYVDRLAYEHKHDFTRKDKILKAYENLSYQDFLAFSKEILSRSNKKRIAFLYQGQLPQNYQFEYHPITIEKLIPMGKYTTKEEISQKEAM